MRIGAYYTHYQCLGHTTRILSILSLLKKTFSRSRFFCLQGSLPQDFLSYPAFLQRYNLPFSLFSRNNFSNPFVADSRTIEKRAASCLNMVKRCRLDVLLTEYFPLGRADCWAELFPSLVHLKKQGKGIFSSVGYPLINQKQLARVRFLIPFYRKIYIHSPEIERDYMASFYPVGRRRQDYLDFFKENESRILFTGYVLPEPLEFKKDFDEHVRFPQGPVRVLVTRGAGAYCPEIILSALQASDILGPGFFFVLVAGPSTTDEEWRTFQKVLTAKRVQNALLVRATADFEALIRQSDVCVCPAPYNTSVLLLKHRKRAVIVPFEGNARVKFVEQCARANLLQDHLGSIVVAAARLTPRRLATAIKQRSERSVPRLVPPQWLNGREAFVKDFREMVSAG